MRRRPPGEPGGRLLQRFVRRRPTLPRGPPRSTIGAVGLSFRVRNGDRAFPRRYDRRNTMEINQPTRTQTPTNERWGLGGPVVSREPHSGRVAPSVSSYRPISTGQLHALLHFHIRPINPVVWLGASRGEPHGNLILKRASRLDAFSGYHFRT